MVTPFLTMPSLPAATPERADLPPFTSAEADASAGAFLVELQKALTPESGETFLKNTGNNTNEVFKNTDASATETGQEISAKENPAENILRTAGSDIFKSISFEKKSPAAPRGKEGSAVLKIPQSAEPTTQDTSGLELLATTPEKIAEILAAFISPQPVEKNEANVFKKAETRPFEKQPLPATLPVPESIGFTFDSLPQVPVQAIAGERVLKAEMPPMPEAEAGKVFKKLSESLELINKELAKQDAFKNEGFSVENIAADKTEFVRESALAPSPEFASSPDFKSEVRVLKGPIVSLEVTLSGEKISPDNKIHVEKSKVHVGKNEVHVLKNVVPFAANEIHVEKSEVHVEKSEVHVEKNGIRVEKSEVQVLKSQDQVLKNEAPVATKEVHVEKSRIHVEKSEVQVFKKLTPEKNTDRENEEFQRQFAAPPDKEIQSHKTEQNSGVQTGTAFPQAMASAGANPVLKTPQPQVLQTEIVHVPVANFAEKAAPAIQKLEKSEGGTMRLVLMPEALGQVKLEVAVSEKTHTTIFLQVENAEAKKQVEAQLPILKEQLVQSGMVIDKINVEVKTDFKNLSQFAGFQQQQPKGEEREGRKKFVDSFKYLRETAGEESGDVRQFIEQYI